jgi:tight adherence protein B
MKSLLLDTPWGTLAVGLLVGGLMFAAAVIALARPRSAWLRTRLEPYGGELTAGSRASLPAWRPDLERLLRGSERAFGSTTFSQRLEAVLARSGFQKTPARFVLTTLGLALTAFAVVGLLIGLGAALLAGLLGLALPLLWTWRAAALRMRMLDDQLPDVLMTMAGSLRVGLTFDHAMQAIVDEGVSPSSEEFARVLHETRLGQPVEDALEALAVRAGSKDLSFVLTAVAIQREVGGSLADLFQTVSETVRSRQQFRRKVRALTATGRMSALVLIALPFVTGGLITAVNPSYMSPLVTTSIGRLLLVALVVMIVVGGSLIRRIVTVEE